MRHDGLQFLLLRRRWSRCRASAGSRTGTSGATPRSSSTSTRAAIAGHSGGRRSPRDDGAVVRASSPRVAADRCHPRTAPPTEHANALRVGAVDARDDGREIGERHPPETRGIGSRRPLCRVRRAGHLRAGLGRARCIRATVTTSLRRSRVELDEPVVSIDGRDFTVAEFIKLVRCHGGWGMRIIFVPDDELHEPPKAKRRGAMHMKGLELTLR